jgi:hypothetical protein
MRISLLAIAGLCLTSSPPLARAQVDAGAPSSKSPPITAERAEFFEVRIRPLLSEHCVSCHGPKKQQSGLRLNSQEGLLKGSDSGPVVVPGRPEESVLIKAIRHDATIKMPPKSKLPDQAIVDLTTWVKLGAPWPENGPAARAGRAGGAATSIAAVARNHWAFQTIKQSPPPAVKNTAWPRTVVDPFILACLEGKGLSPSPRTDKRTLIRRATFDLTGLPPTPEEVTSFDADNSPIAYERLVDRLLASPRYGERWGRYWLDVARYADTKGYILFQEADYHWAYTYRDYVISAFNRDLPYDRFLTEQIAADRLPTEQEFAENAARLIARLVTASCRANTADSINPVVIRALGACPPRSLADVARVYARLLRHVDLLSQESERRARLDGRITGSLPIPALESLRQVFHGPDSPLDIAMLPYGDLGLLPDRPSQARLKELRDAVQNWLTSGPGAPPRALTVEDAPTPIESRVFIRGNPNNLGEPAPRRFLAVLAGPRRKPFQDGSGRLELARAIASRDNPLTALALVNRIWMHHFGNPLVATPGDFGLRSDPPTHPELLDHLAARFIDEGWSIKRLHRWIMLSIAYQQQSDDRPEARSLDPENALYSRMNRRRLDFEAIRDALLAVSGQLDQAIGGPPMSSLTEPASNRRTLYGFVDRLNLPGLYRTFDFPDPTTTSPRRDQTTIAPQALFLMNHPFVFAAAHGILRRPEIAALHDPDTKIEHLYRLIFNRPPSHDEQLLAREFLGPVFGGPNRWQPFTQALLMANEFVYVD